MKKRLPLATSLVLVIVLVLAVPVLAAPPGAWVTDFTLYNLGSSQATITITRYSQCVPSCSSDPGTIVLQNQTVPANGSFPYNPVNDPSFPSGFAGSIAISSTQPLAGVVTMANTLTGSGYASDAYSAVPAPTATTTYLPIVLRQGVWSTRITVQNTGATNANVTITYIGSGAPSATTINNLPGNMMAMVDLSDMGALYFNGSARVEATNPVAVIVEEYKTTGGVLIAYNGVPSINADTTVYMPGFIGQGFWATDFTIVNTESSSATVSVTFSGVGNTLSGSIPANGSVYVNGYAGVYPAGWTGNAPTSGYYGSAKVTSNKNIVIAYNIANSGGGPGNLQAGYIGFPASGSSLDVVVPLIEKYYSTGWITTFSVQSIDGTPASLNLYYSGNLTPLCNPCTYNMPAGESAHTFNQSTDGHVPTGFYGGVHIQSNKQIVVIGDQTNTSNASIAGGDSLSAFVGFVAPALP